jgi:hypothetical protein
VTKLLTLEEWARRRYERPQRLAMLARGNREDRFIASKLLARDGAQTRIARARKACRVLPLDQLRGLPLATEKSRRSAIYFLWQGPILSYVGQSVSVGTRLAAHRCARRQFTHVTILPTPRECLREIERQYIYYYLPSGNAAL